MEIIKTAHLNFSYPASENQVLKDINISVNRGDFITICGKSGCGKTTLLRLLKTAISPFGEISGDIYFEGRKLSDIAPSEQAAKIGFVTQNPDNQIVTDKVWHELAFGLENLGIKTSLIRAKVAEMASFFGISNWFSKSVTELSGGQKQLLNLASVMVMQPTLLILDEPTSQLDPIAAQEFLKTLEKINKELGTTVILTEHRLEDAFTVSDKIIVLDDGKVISEASPEKTGKILKQLNHEMFYALPAPMQIYFALDKGENPPISIRDGKVWIENFSKNKVPDKNFINKEKRQISPQTAVELKDVWFRYNKNLDDVIKDFNLKVQKGEFFAILGGNGTGKSTVLSLISRIYTPYRGKIMIDGKKLSETPNLYNDIIGFLPQNPETLFVKKSVFEDLFEMVSAKNLSDSEKKEDVAKIMKLCQIENLAKSHPYDLSGGEKQRVALAKILLKTPKLLLLDEPTKGMDASFKEHFANIIKSLTKDGVSVIMVSHDMEFCAKHADTCALMFDGNLISEAEPREFFSGNTFYTTSTNRMSRTVLPEAILAEDVISAY